MFQFSIFGTLRFKHIVGWCVSQKRNHRTGDVAFDLGQFHRSVKCETWYICIYTMRYLYIYIFLLYMLYIIHKEMIFLQSCIFLLNIFFCVKFYQKHLDSWDPLFFPGCSMSLCLNWGPGGSDVIVAILFASKTDAVGWKPGDSKLRKNTWDLSLQLLSLLSGTPEPCHGIATANATPTSVS